MSHSQYLGRTITKTTSLPPGIPGPPCAQLRVKVTLLRFNNRFQPPPLPPLPKTRPQASQQRQKQQSPRCDMAVRIVWWGETNPNGILLRPRVIFNGLQTGTGTANSTRLTCALFPVCVPMNKMHSYLKDMGCLFLDVIDTSTGNTIGRARVDNLARLTPQKPILGTMAVASSKGVKIGDLTVGITYELLRGVKQHGVLKKHQSLPRIAPDEPVESFSPSDYSRSNPQLQSIDTEVPVCFPDRESIHFLNKHEPERDPPTREEEEAETDLGTQGPEVMVAEEVEEEDAGDSGLSREVLARIQSALAESRRIREQVFTGINPTIETPPAFDKEALDGHRLLKGDQQMSEPLPEMRKSPSRLFLNDTEGLVVAEDGEDFLTLLGSKSNSDIVGVRRAAGEGGFYSGVDCFSDTELEKDLVIDSILLPPKTVAEANYSNDAENATKSEKAVEANVNTTTPVPPKALASKNSITTEFNCQTFSNGDVDDKTSRDVHPSSIRLAFRRLTFPVQVWNALRVVLSSFAAPERKKSSATDPKGKKNVRIKNGSSSKHTGQRKSSPNRSAIKSAPQQDVKAGSCTNTWDFYLEAVVPSEFVDAGGVCGFQEEAFWVQRISLCRGISKHSANDPNVDEATVFIVPQRRSASDEPIDEQPIVLSSNHSIDLDAQPIQLSLLCRPPATNKNPTTVPIGKIEILFDALMSSLYQNPAGIPSKTSNAEPKTLRVRIDFEEPIRQRLRELLVSEKDGDALLKTSFGFINVEPIWRINVTPQLPLHQSEDELNAALLFNRPESQHNHHQDQQPYSQISKTSSATFPLDILLNLRAARDLRPPQGALTNVNGTSSSRLQHSFLVVRVPWCCESTTATATPNRHNETGARSPTCKTKRFQSAVAWGSGTAPAFHFGLRASATLSEEQISRLASGFIAIEVWARRTGCGTEKDELIGLAKVMTAKLAHLQRLSVSSPSTYASSRFPLLQEDSWLQISSPSTGQSCGQLHSRFCAGTASQVSNLLKSDQATSNTTSAASGALVDWRCIDFIRWRAPRSSTTNPTTATTIDSAQPSESSTSSNMDLISMSVKHALDISLLSVTDFRPSISETLQRELGVEMFLFNDCDCFIQYRVPTDTDAPSAKFRSPLRPLQPLVQPTPDVSIAANAPTSDTCDGCMEIYWENAGSGGDAWHESHGHTFVMEAISEASVANALHRLDGLAFLDWMGRGSVSSAGGGGGGGIGFELWLRLYSPKLREICVARGLLSWDLLEHHLLRPVNAAGKLEDFLPEWQRALSKHALALYDTRNPGTMAARLFLNIAYSQKTLLQRCTGATNVNSQHNEPMGLHPGSFAITGAASSSTHSCSCFCSSSAAVAAAAAGGPSSRLSRAPLLQPSTERPGVHLHAKLHALTGLWGSPALLNLAASDCAVQLRVHCLLLLPPPSSLNRSASGCRQCSGGTSTLRLLASTVVELQQPGEVKLKLDALLPLAWKYTSAESKRSHLHIPGDSGVTIFSLAEALAYSQVEIADRGAWVQGRVSRPCLLLQVDVWSNSADENATTDDEDQPHSDDIATTSSLDSVANVCCFWGIDYDSDRGLELRPSGNHRLLASCRMPLGDLLATGSLPPRWTGLLEVPSPPQPSKVSDPLAYCSHRLVGAVEVSANLGASSNRRRVLEDAFSMTPPANLKALRALGFDWTAFDSAISRIPSCPRSASLDREKRRLTFRFSTARLPKEEELLSSEELQTCQERGLLGRFFARAILDGGVQLSDSHPLPRASTKNDGETCEIAEFEESMQFCLNLGPQSHNAILEIQIWAKWLPAEQEKTRHGNPRDLVNRAPAPRCLGYVQLPLTHLLSTLSPSLSFPSPPPSPEVFYWTFIKELEEEDEELAAVTPADSEKAPRGAKSIMSLSTCSLEYIPVYPLMQPTTTVVEALGDAWVAATVSLSTPCKEPHRGTILPKESTISNHGALLWLPSDQAGGREPETQLTSQQHSLFSSTSDAFPAYVLIERANRIPPSDSIKEHAEIETFATFTVADESDSGGGRSRDAFPSSVQRRTIVTPLASSGDRTAPVWNYRRYVNLPTTLVTDESKSFCVDVWQRSRQAAGARPLHLGTAKMQLSTLLVPSRRSASNALITTSCASNAVGGETATGAPGGGGLEFVRGWYEILDAQGKSRGQLLMGVYPLGENEESPAARRLCPRLESLLDPEGNASNGPPVNPIGSQVKLFEENLPKPVLMNQLLLPSFNGKGQSSSMEVDDNVIASSISSLLTSLQSRMEELDMQNARFKQKLLTEHSGEAPDPRPGKGSKFQVAYLTVPTPYQQMTPADNSVETVAVDNFNVLCGTGDNNSKIRTASSASDVSSQSSVSIGDSDVEEEEEEDEEKGEEAEEECEAEEDEEIVGPHVDEDEADEQDAILTQTPNTSAQEPLPIAQVFRNANHPSSNATWAIEKGGAAAGAGAVEKASQLQEIYNDDPTSLVSTSVSSLASHRGAVLLKSQFSDPASATEVWSASSTDVEEYIQRFRRNRVVPPALAVGTEGAVVATLVEQEEVEESLRSISQQKHACIATTHSPHRSRNTSRAGTADSPKRRRRPRRHTPGPLSSDDDEDDNCEDSDAPTATYSLEPPPDRDHHRSQQQQQQEEPASSSSWTPGLVEEVEASPIRSPVAPVPHANLQALRMAREAAESVRRTQPGPAEKTNELRVEDPIRKRIHENLSSMVRKTISATGERLQHSEATAAAIIKSGMPPAALAPQHPHSAGEAASVSSSASEPSSQASVRLSSRSLARAARIFEMKL